MKHEVSAGVIVYRYGEATPDRPGEKQGELLYLVLHYISGHWDFAKGKLEAGETKHQAALRELQEETGLTAKLDDSFEQSLSYYFRNKQGELVDKEVTFFLGKTDAIDVTLSREHVYYQWLPFQDAVKQLTYENARQVLRRAHWTLTARTPIEETEEGA